MGAQLEQDRQEVVVEAGVARLKVDDLHTGTLPGRPAVAQGVGDRGTGTGARSPEFPGWRGAVDDMLTA
ncbi:hypothetical protein GCM10014713_25540 [Streptomyces purpureus]|uniref:Uncharacterized protein n=1 Tax=Streptomyces purpureus TaxID=1951 RepID=A0A918H0U8_9ACTN|nr:hypothetical protein GCM10014713_25540 [Streptomyces purpureus]